MPIFLPLEGVVDVDRDTTVGIVSIIEHGNDDSLTTLFDPAKETTLEGEGLIELEALRSKLIDYLHTVIVEEADSCFS